MKHIRGNNISEFKNHRLDVCMQLGFESLSALHEFITDGVKRGSDNLLLHGLTAEVLLDLGYSAEGMKKMGFHEDTLARLGYQRIHHQMAVSDCEPQPVQNYSRQHNGRHSRFSGNEFAAGRYQEIRELIRLGYRAKTLKSRGFNVLYCKNAGFSARDLLKIGFNVGELVNVFNIHELKNAGCFPYELENYYTKEQLLSAGYTPDVVLLAGYKGEDIVNTDSEQNQV